MLSSVVGSVAAASSAATRVARRGESELHRDAVVGVADHAVERAEPVPVGLDIAVGDGREHSGRRAVSIVVIS